MFKTHHFHFDVCSTKTTKGQKNLELYLCLKMKAFVFGSQTFAGCVSNQYKYIDMSTYLM